MIVSIGLPDRNFVSFKLSQKLSELNAPVYFLGPFSNSGEHLDLLNELIDRCILFDPVFCNTNGKLSDFTYERLKQFFDVNSDIDVVCIDKAVYEDPNVLSVIRKAFEGVHPKEFLINEETDLEKLCKDLVGGEA